MRFGSCFDQTMRSPDSSGGHSGRSGDRANGTGRAGLQPVFALRRFVRIYPLFLTEHRPISAHHPTVRISRSFSRTRTPIRASATFSRDRCPRWKLAERRRMSKSSGLMETPGRVAPKFASGSNE